MGKKKSRNIVLLKSVDDLKDEIPYNDFAHGAYFSLLCSLVPNRDNEKISIKIVDEEKYSRAGLVYVFVIEWRIFKIGHTITSIQKRIQSYNCGKTEYRISGTNSTTNYFVLQSILNIGMPVSVYAFFPDQPKYNIFGKEYQDSFPTSKRAENEILTKFIEQHKKKPIWCTQT